MTDREPVNIMGVIAFPNPDKDQRVIRFIDSEYHTLFTIKDGESIVITRFDGEKMAFPCKYIDDCHVCIGNSAYPLTTPTGSALCWMASPTRNAVSPPNRASCGSAKCSSHRMKSTSSS